MLQISFVATDETNVSLAFCSRPIGLSGLCAHVVGALYQLAHYKALGYRALPEVVAKTSQPQTFHVPRGTKIQGKAVQDLQVRGYSRKRVDQSGTSEDIPRNIQSTLYNLIRGERVDWKNHANDLEATVPNILILPTLQETFGNMVDTKFGKTFKGSVLSYQQKPEAGYIINIFDGVDYPDLPVKTCMENTFQFTLDEQKNTNFENLKISKQEAIRFEQQTRLQSQTSLWYKIRRNRLTVSKIGEIFKRKKEPTSLVRRLKTTRYVTTEAMRQGLASEPAAASEYARLKTNVNIYPCGVIVNVWAPWLAASPDLKVYNTNMTPPFGLLEFKCPQVSSVLEVPYLRKDCTGALKLNRNHSHYYQVLAQLAVTGLEWCDFYVWCSNDSHCETNYFNGDIWNYVKEKVDDFFFNHFI